jgi:hypothetical protein
MLSSLSQEIRFSFPNMKSETTPHLRLILDNSDHGGLITSWAPTDSLTGHLELSDIEFSAIKEISIYFEGLNMRCMDYIKLSFYRRVAELDY